MEELVIGGFSPWIGLVFLVINTGSFLLLWWDKAQSRRKGAERISEGVLFFLAAAFGSLGVYLGMLLFRHKTHKWYFLIGMPLLILENIALLYVIISIVLNRSL